MFERTLGATIFTVAPASVAALFIFSIWCTPADSCRVLSISMSRFSSGAGCSGGGRRASSVLFRAQRAVNSLFRRFTIEVFVVRFRIGAGRVDNAVPMVRRRIERIELQWTRAGVDDVVDPPQQGPARRSPR